jgi:hypothetical protein
MRCQKPKRDGSQCKASALTGKKYCALHSDASRAAELGRRGGRRRTVFAPDSLKMFPAPKSAADARDLLAQSMVELRAGRLDPRIATSTCCLVTEFLKCLELCTIEDVIEPLEQERAQQGGFKDATDRNKENT